MLFRPAAQDRLQDIHTNLLAWSADADRFRQAAAAAQRDEQQSVDIVRAAEDLHDALMSALEDLDRSLDGISPGKPEFTAVLNLQTKTLSLLESVGTSLDVLMSYVPDEHRADAVSTSRKPLLAAE